MVYRALALVAYLTFVLPGEGAAQPIDSFDIRAFGNRYPAVNIDSLLVLSGSDAGFNALREAFYVAGSDIPLDVAAGVYYGGAVQPDVVDNGGTGVGAGNLKETLAKLSPQEATRRTQYFSDHTYRRPGCLECHYEEHEMWLATGDTAQANTSYARFMTIARAIAFERSGETFAEAWPVTSVRDEYILLSLAGCQPTSHGLVYDGDGVPYDVFQANCAGEAPEGSTVARAVYFDIRVYWATFTAGFGGMTPDRIRQAPRRKQRKRRQRN